MFAKCHAYPDTIHRESNNTVAARGDEDIMMRWKSAYPTNPTLTRDL